MFEKFLRSSSKSLLQLSAVGTLVSLCSFVHAQAEVNNQVSDINLRRGVTEISSQVYDLHMMMFVICLVIGGLVFSVMFVSMYLHRKSKGVKAANFHENIKVEIAWTVIPFIILIAMAIPAAKTLIAMEDVSKADITILVTGSQWKWHYKYMDSDIEFNSLLSTDRTQIENQTEKSANYLLEVDKPLVIPTNQKVRFLITSDDVIHSWWVPDFAVKKDANPGFINEAWTKVEKPGTYRGQCAELCGKDHGFMPIVVEAKTESDFAQWLNEEQARQQKAKEDELNSLFVTLSMEELMTEGERVYNAVCAACHMPNGQGLPGVFPALKGSPMALNDIPGHIDIVVNGKAGTAMQAFDKMLTKQEIAAVVTYERNAWGNNTGDIVQAKDVHSVATGN